MKNIFRYVSLIAMLCSSLFAQTAVGNLKGTLAVNQGSLHYSVDILTPPGVAGVEPKLSFEYNQQNGGSGHLGLGWSIGGLSAISRCGSTLAQDGKNKGLKYDYSDNYCMDGQRLIPVKGSKGKNGTEYRTEIDSYSKIISHGSSGNGPAYFKVYTKSGDIYEYGNSNNSKAKLANNTIRIWAVNKISDKLENYDNTIKFLYNEELGIREVKYADDKNIIRFNYDNNRNDKFTGFIFGKKTSLSKKINSVDIYASNQVVRQYKLNYTSMHKLTLGSIQEHAGGKSLEPLKFSWTDDGKKTRELGLISRSNSINSDKVLSADFNGDGVTDLYVRDADNGKDIIRLGDIYGKFNRGVIYTKLDLSDRLLFADFNNDGYIDIYQTHKKRHEILLNNGKSKFNPPIAIDAKGKSTRAVRFADMDGDGDMDIVYAKYYRSSKSHRNYYLNFIENLGNKKFSKAIELNLGRIRNDNDFHLADMNGDGEIDIITTPLELFIRHINIWLNSSNSFVKSHNFSVRNSNIIIADINGDGNQDIVVVRGNKSEFFWINDGTGTYSKKDFGINFAKYADRLNFIDFNGDGYIDIYNNKSKELWLNQASWSDDSSAKFKKDYNFNANIEAKNLRFGDFNGNGAVDFYDAKKNANRVFFNPAKKPVIKSITDSFKNEYTIDYKNLTDTSIYKKLSSAKYPTIDIQPAMKVVKSVTTSESKIDYTYKGLKADTKGRGSLGFSEIKTTDEIQGRYTITSYYQNFPFTGVVASETSYLLDGTELSFNYNEYTVTGAKIKKIQPKRTIEKSYYPNITKTTKYKGYDKYGNVLEMETKTEGNGEEFIKTTTNVYDNIESEWLLGRLVDSTVAHEGGDIDTYIERRSEFVYNQEGMLEKEIIIGDKTLKKTYEYDAYGNKTKETISGDDIKSRSTSFIYDSNHQFPIKITKPLGHTEEMKYNRANGKLEWKKINNNNNLKTTYKYDAFGKPTNVTSADGTRITYKYGLSSSAPGSYYYVEITKNGAKPIRTYHDSFDRKVRTQKTGFNGKTIYEDTYYNKKGEVYQATAPYFAGEEKTWIRYTYDKFDRPLTTTEPSPEVGEKTTTIAYNDNNFETVTTNAKNQEKRVTKNALGKVTKVEEEMSATIEHQYDAVGNLRVSIEPSNAQIQMEYDSFGNKTYMNDPDMGEWRYTYNVLGELISQTDAKKQTTTITYDALGRMTNKTSTDENSQWIYDTVFKGALSSEKNNKGFSKTYKYDSYGKVISATTTIDGTKYTKSFTYDGNNRIDTVTEPNNFKIKHDYNSNGQLISIKTPKGAVEEISQDRLKELVDKALTSINDYKEKALEYEKKAKEFSAKADYYTRVANAYKNRKDYGKRLKAYAKKLRRYSAYYKRVALRYQSSAKYYQQRADKYFKKAKSSWWGRGFYRWYAKRYAAYAKRSIAIAKRYNYYANYYNNVANIYDRYGNYYDSVRTDRTIVYYTNKAKESAKVAKAATLKAKSYYQMANSSQQASLAYQEIIADAGYTYFYKVLDKDAFGRTTSYLSGNGLINQKSYDKSGVMNYVTTGFGGDEYLRNINYTYDALGNVQTRVDDILNINQDFEYDSLNRIISSQTGGNNLYLTPMSYDYDTNGNMSYKSDIGNYSYDNPNHIHAVTRAGKKTFKYDANDNMINNNGQLISYNSANKPTQIKTKSSTINFTYNQNGQRYKKQSNGTTTHYLGKTYEKIKDSRGNTDHRYYIYADGKVQAIHTNSSDGDFTTRYLHYMLLPQNWTQKNRFKFLYSKIRKLGDLRWRKEARVSVQSSNLK